MAGDENKTDPVTLCGDSGAGNQPCGSFKCLNMGLQRWIGFMVLVEMVWQVSATGTGPISREWGEEANLAGRNARSYWHVNNEQLPRCTDKPDSAGDHPLIISLQVAVVSPSGSITLPCKLSKNYSKPTLVTWKKDGVAIATYHSWFSVGYKGSYPRWKFVNNNILKHRDASLVLWGVQEKDAGTYTCIWSTSHHGKCHVLTWLKIERNLPMIHHALPPIPH
ncbi:uncharacterized protein LOC129708937 [Leucoraja erinacea]|uniref:uncharacterized protein LOC129708937 n=1 Tax=Leucoraja erinaceus TaxID=7782 RepID=UPI002456C074|nr:uncharacterized protein LOC129708937 [Leucoraja erinacea]